MVISLNILFIKKCTHAPHSHTAHRKLPKKFGPVSFSLYLTPYTTNHFFFSFLYNRKIPVHCLVDKFKMPKTAKRLQTNFLLWLTSCLGNPCVSPFMKSQCECVQKVFYPPEISVRWGPPTFRTHEIIVQPLIFNANETLHQQLIGIPGSSKALFSPTYNPYPNLNRTKIPLPKP